MGRLRNREAWEQQLSAHVMTALETWLAEQLFDLRHRGWFTDGRSNDPVARAMRVYPDDTDQLVLKFFTEDGAKKVLNIRKAWRTSNDYHRYLAEPKEEVIFLKDQRAIFMHVAGGNLDAVQPLTALRREPEFPGHCATIIRSIVAGWNGGNARTTERKVADVLTDIMGRRMDDATAWAEELGIDVDGSPDAVSLSGWPEALVNPFTLVAGEEGDRTVEALIIGKAHGDLSGRNVLVPTSPEVAADSYVLIDYDRFSDQAPLARDPMHLVVALVLDGFDRFGPESLVDLARVLVDPDTKDTWYVEPARMLSRAVRTAAAPKPEKGLGAEWTQQCLLSLVGAGLVHLGRPLYTKDPDVAKGWCFHLAALAAQAYLQVRPPRDRVTAVPSPTPSTAGDESGHRQLVNRQRERNGLQKRLTRGPWGVVVLRGTRGVGKTALVNAVLDDLEKGRASGVSPRIHRYDINATARLNARTLIDFVADEVAPTPRLPHGGSSLVRLEAALRRLGESRVVVSVDSVENLLDPVTRQLVDPDLDEMLELLATERGHRVTVLLVTQDEPASSIDGTWPTAEEPIVLRKLDNKDFFGYLARLDRNGSLALAGLPHEQRDVLYNKLQGNPRLAELVYAVVVVAESGFNLGTFTDTLHAQEHRDVPAYLTRLLVDGLSPLRRRVLEALAAFDIPVPKTAVVGLLNREASPENVCQALEILAAHRVVYQALPESELYFLPRKDGQLVLNQMRDENARVKQYFSAATQLTFLQNSAPRGVADLQMHFAELRALLRAKEYPSAENMIREMDRAFLRKWNCSDLLLEQREEVRGRLADDYLEMLNENALGGIYVSLGQLPQADSAYGEALRIAAAQHDDARLMRIRANLAAMYWERNDTGRALGYFEYARDEAERAGDLVVHMGALEGIADCHRRRGHYGEAIRHAQNALAVPSLPGYPDTTEAQSVATIRSVTIALKLARWYGELGRADDAERHIEVARAVTQNSDDGWSQASYLDGRADMLLDRGNLEAAESASQEAVDQALLLNDPVTLLQARTTLCLIYLKTYRVREARHVIKGAWRYRRTDRSLIVLALLALTTRLTGDRIAADQQFEQLLSEASTRIERDQDDFGAWDFKGYAICGLHLETPNGLDDAISAFQTARSLTPPTPVLVDRLRYILTQLDRDGRRLDRLQPIIDTLSGPR